MARRKKKKGYFIAFEGGEGSGKSTQMKTLARWLRGQRFPVLITQEPGGTPIGIRIRNLLLNPQFKKLTPRAELFLYAADRAQHMTEKVTPALKVGKVILSDRHADSTNVYQGICRKLGLTWTQEVNRFATAGLTPDLVFILDVPVGVGLRRARKRHQLDRMEREKLAFHNQVRKGFLKLAQKSPRRYVVIDANRSRSVIQGEIRQVVAKRLGI